MTIHIEISKSAWNKNKWNMRVGDLGGCSELINISGLMLIKEIKEQLKIEEGLNQIINYEKGECSPQDI